MAGPHGSKRNRFVTPSPSGFLSSPPVLIAFIAAALLPLSQLGSFSSWTLCLGDEGVVLNGARRLLLGQVPYRDFYALITPGSFYLTAASFKIFGESLFSARSLMWVVHVATLFTFLGLASRFKVADSWKVVGLLSLLAFGTPCLPVISHHWIANLFVLASASCLVRENDRVGWPLAAGALGALGALTLQDQGGYWLLGAAAAIGFCGGVRRFRTLLAFVSGALGGGVLGGAHLLLAVPFRTLWNALVVSPLTLYRAGEINRAAFGEGALASVDALREHLRSTDLPMRPLWLLFDVANAAGSVLVMAIFVVAFLGLVWGLWRSRATGADSKTPAVLLALLASFFLTALHRPAFTNFIWAFPAAILGALWSLEGAPRWRWRRWQAPTAACLAALFGLVGVCQAFVFPSLMPSTVVNLPAATVRAFNTQDAEALELAKSFRQSAWRPGDRVFCYSYNGALYFYLGLPYSTPYDIFDAPLHPEEEVSDLVAALEKAPPEWLLWDLYSGPGDPLRGWLEKHYALAGRSGKLVVGRRKTPPPAESLPARTP